MLSPEEIEDAMQDEIARVAATPKRPGHYWGRWHTPAPDTADDGGACDGETWEVHLVYEDSLASYLRAFVPGVEEPQPLDAFEWGEEVVRGPQQ